MVDLSMAMLVITREYLQRQSPRFLRFPAEEGARNRSRRCKTGWRRVIFGIWICETLGSLGHSGASFLPDLQPSNLETAHIGEIIKNNIKSNARPVTWFRQSGNLFWTTHVFCWWYSVRKGEQTSDAPNPKPVITHHQYTNKDMTNLYKLSNSSRLPRQWGQKQPLWVTLLK